MQEFFVGTHQVNWLARPGNWFVSVTRMERTRKFPRAVSPWGLDSGAFSSLYKHAGFVKDARTYATQVNMIEREVGNLSFCAPQDWMCEPFMLERTGLDVETHQLLTICNFLELRATLGNLVIPVLQGWSPWDYMRHVDMYMAEGVDLTKEHRVGVGSICRRQHTAQASQILSLVQACGIPVHAFGLKLQGLRANSALIKSGDSMAWSFDARRKPALAGHTHRNCANCIEYAELWREKVRPYVDGNSKSDDN